MGSPISRRLLALDIRRSLLVCVLPLVALTAALFGLRFCYQVDSIQKSNLDLAEATAVAFDNYLDDLWDVEHALGGAIFSGHLDKGTANRLLSDQLEVDRTICNFAVLDSSGRVVAATRRDALGRSFQDRDYLRKHSLGAERLVSNLTVGRLSRQPILIVSSAIRLDSGLQGIVVATVDAEHLAKALPTRTGKASIGLVDTAGMIVYWSGAAQLPLDRRLSPARSPAWLALKGETGYSVHVRAPGNSAERVGVAIPVRGVGWAAISCVPWAETLEPTYKSVLVGFIAAVVVIAAALFVLRGLQSEMSKHAVAISQAATSLAAGHYEARVSVSTESELASADQAFNSMAQRIQELEHDRLRFIQLAAHELRTPMTSVKGICGLLSRRIEADPDTKSLATILDGEVNHLSGLVNDILNSFLIQEGRYTLEKCPVDLTLVVEDTLKPFAVADPRRFTCDTPCEPVMVMGDAKRLHQVFKNLLSNATKYSEPGTPIDVKVWAEGACALASVTDTGRGIPADELEKVFEPFYRASNVEDQPEAGGIGLGLNLCRDVIQRHGGEVWVESKEGAGSTFYVKLPLIAG